ncbi:hypothetical protein [Natronococcus sp. A-GB7]|uniref:hypothetical protein n=1 Tax=Natronococcus sp. A-GB7 TaxID=3037649 RepID=UPI00241C1B66|nr:hypothetical protein [Natronococcus sp. A-GB7]MDG5821642.1 hypothetical protein [Natronococcus sp. A-GB7]
MSNAITHRLRYLSYWAWVAKHADEYTQANRALYEKIYLFANVAHDCSGNGTEGKGIVNASRTIGDDVEIADLYQSTGEVIDISSDHFTLTNGQSGFDQYYKGLLYNLLLFENEDTLSPLGHSLADAFDEAVAVAFEDIKTAVNEESVSTTLVERFGTDGCLCRISSRERTLLAKAHLGLTNRATSWDELAFMDDTAGVTISISQYLTQDKHTTAQEITDTESKYELDDEVELTDLEAYMAGGQDVFARSSLLVLLLTLDQVVTAPSEEPQFGSLADTRELWRFVIYSEYFSDAYETLLIALYQALAATGPAEGETIVQRLTTHEAFAESVSLALTGVEIKASDKDPDRLKQLKWSIYYGTAWRNSPELRLNDRSPSELVDPDRQSWQELRAHIVNSHSGFRLEPPSEWTFRKLIERSLETAPSIDRSARLCAYASLLLATLQGRYDHYFSQDMFAPHRRWFLETQRPPSARQLWAFPYNEEESFRTVVQEITRQSVLEGYLERLYTKLGDTLGKSPQLVSIDADGTLAYERSFNNDQPNLPTLKYDRTADLLYELGWISTDSLSEASITERGQNVIAHFLNTE